MPSQDNRDAHGVAPAAHVQPSRPPLRVGILVDELSQPAWIRRIITDVQASSIADLTLVVTNVASPPPRAGWRKLLDRPQHALYGLYCAIDRYLFAQRPDGQGPRISPGGAEPAADAAQSASIADLVADAAHIAVDPVQKGFSDYFTDADVETILAHELDVVLRFGFRSLRGRSLDLARYGVWSYHHGDNRVNRGGPAAFWEIFERAPTTGSILQILTEDLDNGPVIYRATLSTDPYSVTTNRNNCFWISASFVQRCLRDLYAADPAAPWPDPRDREPVRPYSNRLYTTPRNREMARLLMGHVGRVLALRLAHALVPEQWALAYARGENVLSMHRLRYRRPDDARLWADPFPVAHADGRFVFFEEQLPGERGHIAVSRVEDDGTWSPPSVALRCEHHLSYPFVFEWEGSMFMVPESASERRAEVYRCIGFPDRWRLEQVLLNDVRAADATLARLGDTWWMFVSIAPEEVPIFDELHLFHASSPLGPWTAHARNPVKCDATNSRPAGRLFTVGEKLYRPAQDCGPRYGYATVINEITRLDGERFEEREVSRLQPGWDRAAVATHTFNSVPGLTVCDVRLRLRPAWLRRRPSSR